MTTKDRFTEYEWMQLRQALAAPGLFIIASDPRSEGDIAREMRAMEQFYANLRDRANRLGLENKLLEALLTDTTEATSPQSGQSEDESTDLSALQQKYLDTISQAVSLLAQKASNEEADEIRKLMYELAGQTAAASKEGAFLGVRGVRVTEAERAALKAVADALGINPADVTESWPLPGE